MIRAFVQFESNLKKMTGLFFQKVYRKVAHVFHHYPQRAIEMVAYGCRRLTGHAFPEPELTWQQKWQSNFILSGCRQVRIPGGYFNQQGPRLEVIDDIRSLPLFFWEKHLLTELPLPNTAAEQQSFIKPWLSPEASFILMVNDGYVAPDGMVFDSNFIVRNGRWFYQSPPGDLTVERYGRLLTLVQIWGRRFIHFSFDTLPRIDMAYEFLKANPDVRILVPDADFYKEIFQALGIDPQRLVFARPDRIYAAKEIFYPHFYSSGQPHKMGLIPLDSFQRVRKFLAGEVKEQNNLIVYLKRPPQANRQVAGEDGMLEAVSGRLKPDYHLKVYEPVNDWRRDRDVLSKARVVFGPHGGAWSNIVFCREGVDVVEFLPLIQLRDAGKNERPCYYGLACGLGLKYWSITPDNFYFDRPAAMRVPVEELLTVLQRIGVAS